MIGASRPRSFVAILALFAVTVAVPLATLTLLAASWYVGSERARLTAAAHATGQRLAERLDRELAELSVIARTLATSPLIDSGDFSIFDAQARRILEVKEASVTVSELDGRQLVNTRAEPGSPLPTVNRPEIVAEILRTRQPVVTGVLVSGLTGRRIVGVSAPVIRDGVVTKVVTAVVRIEHLERLVAEAGIARPYSAAILDGAGRIVARTPEADGARTAGPARASAEIVSFRDPSRLSGWTVVSGLDKAAMEAPLRQSLILFGTLGLVLLGLGGLFGWLTIRHATRAARSLAEAARTIGRGEVVAPAASAIREADIIGKALGAASRTLADQRALIAASQARLEAHVAERGRELEASRAHYRVLADNVGDVIVMRRQGSHDLSYVSPSSSAMFGYDPDEVRAFGIADNIHPEDVPAVRAVDATLGAGQTSVRCQFRTRRRDGHWIWVESVSTRIAGAGPDEPDVISVLRDVTARQAQAEELRIARDTAELAQAKAENASRAKSEFLAVMSHEIRTPLSTIKGFTELLAETEPLDAEQRRYVALVGDATATMLTAVDDILDLAKVESGDLRLDPRPFTLARALEAVTSFARPIAASQAMTVGLTLAPDLPEHVLGDERRLRQVLLNLLTAILRSRRGGLVTVTVDRRRPGTDQGRLDIAVTASGGRALAHERPGLGLTIAQRLVGLMGGRLESAGSSGHSGGDLVSYRFSARLPAAEAPAAGRADAAEAPPRRPGRLLVAEDHVINQEIVRRMLERDGHSVDIVADGEQALAAVQAERYDVVLMDIQMPVMDGLAATRRIRALPHPCRHVPIVAMTANVLPEQVRGFREAGMDGHVPKPLDRERLRETIDALLSSVMVVEANSGEAAPTIFDRAAYDGLVASLGREATQAVLRGFIALLDAAHADAAAIKAEAGTVAVGARRLGFLELAAEHDRLAAVEGEAVAEALSRCRVARELVHRVLDELTEGGRAEVAARVALL